MGGMEEWGKGWVYGCVPLESEGCHGDWCEKETGRLVLTPCQRHTIGQQCNLFSIRAWQNESLCFYTSPSGLRFSFLCKCTDTTQTLPALAVWSTTDSMHFTVHSLSQHDPIFSLFRQRHLNDSQIASNRFRLFMLHDTNGLCQCVHACELRKNTHLV